MRAKDVRIIPLDVGTLEWDQSECTLRRGIGKRVKAPFIAWYIEGLEKKVLIDTGPPNQERAQRLHKAFNPIISPEQETPQRLRQIGLKPEDIEILVLTHLPWDHVGHADKFPHARIFVSREEFNYAMAPLPPTRGGYGRGEVTSITFAPLKQYLCDLCGQIFFRQSAIRAAPPPGGRR